VRLQAEIKRRADADKQIHNHFETELKTVQDRMSLQMNEMQIAVRSSIDGISRTVQDLSTVFKYVHSQADLLMMPETVSACLRYYIRF
jgi:cell fate (sporulation/competence/biofilm development) regulator YlbF (YheA/YmcA/DUF963 family)